MPTTIHTRWKLLVNLDSDGLLSIAKLFNIDTGRAFVRSLGGRSSLEFSPQTLTCTTRFFDLLRRRASELGFVGRKFPLRHVELGVSVNVRFRLYGQILVAEVERSPVAAAAELEWIDQTSLWTQGQLAELILNILGIIRNPTNQFQPVAQKPKVFVCNCVVGDDATLPSNEALVRLLTRHRTAAKIVVSQVVEKNQSLQSDSSTLLVDRQGVVACVPASLALDETTMRRYPAAANMLELIAVVERMLERDQFKFLSKKEFVDLAGMFSDPKKRFRFSTSSLHIWQCLAGEFGLTPEAWNKIEESLMNEKATREQSKSIVIVTALEAEAGPSLRRLNEVVPENRSGVYLNRGNLKTASGSATVYVCSVGVGNAKAIMNTTRLLDVLRPDLTVFCGIAGGRKEAEIGSVVVANLVYNYESGKEKSEGLAPRPRHVGLSPSAEFLASAFLAKERTLEKTYEVFMKPIACGEKVVGTTKGVSAAVIESTYGDALAVEMEGFGFLSALEHTRSPALLVRGVSDRLDRKEETEDHGLAIENATDLVFRLIDFFVAAQDVPRAS